MSLTFGFYNSVSGDRVYDAVQISSIFDGIIEDGVFSSIGSKLMVIPGTGMNIIVGTGRAWFNHSWTNNDSPLVLSVATANAAWTRKDIVVLEVNSDNAVRANSLKIITGVPALNPVLPTLTSTEYVHQYPLAYLEIGPNVTEVNASKITNMVGSDQTPYVIGVVNTISIADLMAQFESQFSNWFEEMKDQLSTDAAGNLQVQLDEHDHTSGHGGLITSAGISPTAGILGTQLSSKTITVDQIQNRTRKIFLPIVGGMRGGVDAPVASRGFLFTAADGGIAYLSSIVPYDFVSNLTFQPIWYDGLVSASIKYRINISYGGDGESYNAHQNGTAYVNDILTASKYKLGQAWALPGASIGDIIDLTVLRSVPDGADNVWLRGIIMSYLANS